MTASQLYQIWNIFFLQPGDDMSYGDVGKYVNNRFVFQNVSNSL